MPGDPDSAAAGAAHPAKAFSSRDDTGGVAG
jgi:hypothetical protein